MIKHIHTPKAAQSSTVYIAHWFQCMIHQLLSISNSSWKHSLYALYTQIHSYHAHLLLLSYLYKRIDSILNQPIKRFVDIHQQFIDSVLRIKKKTPAHVYVCVCVLCINNGNSSSKCDYLICVTIRMKGGGVCEWEREREREREEGKGWGRERKKKNTPEVPLYYSATCQPVQRVYSMTGIAALFLINAHHLRHHSEY